MRLREGRRLDHLDVIDEAHVGRGACADLDVDGDLGRHVIMRETDDARGHGRVPADARGPHPRFRRHDATQREHVFRVRPKPVHLVDEERVGEFEALAHPLQPRAALVKKIGQPVARLAVVAAIKSDKLLRRQLRVSAQGFEDAEDVVLGDRRALAGWRGVRTWAVFSCG